MPRLAKSVPSFCHHKAMGQAVVCLNGHDIYLGVHGTSESKAEYDRVIAEWLARGRSMPQTVANLAGATVNGLLVGYFQ